MNARQARRIVLWMNGQYLVAADHFGLDDEEMESLSDEDMTRLNEAQRTLGEELEEAEAEPKYPGEWASGQASRWVP